jgi:hypothetical protein
MKDSDFGEVDAGLKVQIASLAGSARLLVVVAIAVSSLYLIEKLLLIAHLLSKGI